MFVCALDEPANVSNAVAKVRPTTAVGRKLRGLNHQGRRRSDTAASLLFWFRGHWIGIHEAFTNRP